MNVSSPFRRVCNVGCAMYAKSFVIHAQGCRVEGEHGWIVKVVWRRRKEEQNTTPPPQLVVVSYYCLFCFIYYYVVSFDMIYRRRLSSTVCIYYYERKHFISSCHYYCKDIQYNGELVCIKCVEYTTTTYRLWWKALPTNETQKRHSSRDESRLRRSVLDTRLILVVPTYVPTTTHLFPLSVCIIHVYHFFIVCSAIIIYA